jgi:hypothetical protein
MPNLPAQIDVGPFIYDVADDAALIDKVSGPDDALLRLHRLLGVADRDRAWPGGRAEA